MPHYSERSWIDSGVRNVLRLPKGHGCYKRQAWSKRDSIRTKQHGYKSAVCSLLPSFIQDSLPAPPPPPTPGLSLPLTQPCHTHTHSHVHTDTHFPSLRCILVSGVLCFSSQGREESGPGSKLTINSTLPETQDKKQHIHSIFTPPPSPSPLLLLLLPPFSPLLITGALPCRIVVFSFSCLCFFFFYLHQFFWF